MEPGGIVLLHDKAMRVLLLDFWRRLGSLFESTLAAGDAKWADYEMPLKTEDEQPWAVAVALPDLKGPWGDFMRSISVDWHKSGKLLALDIGSRAYCL